MTKQELGSRMSSKGSCNLWTHTQIRNKELSEESISPPMELSSLSGLNQIANCENADGILPLSAFTRCQSRHQQSFCQPGILRFLLFADHLFSGHNKK